MPIGGVSLRAAWCHRDAAAMGAGSLSARITTAYLPTSSRCCSSTSFSAVSSWAARSTWSYSLNRTLPGWSSWWSAWIALRLERYERRSGEAPCVRGPPSRNVRACFRRRCSWRADANILRVVGRKRVPRLKVVHCLSLQNTGGCANEHQGQAGVGVATNRERVRAHERLALVVA